MSVISKDTLQELMEESRRLAAKYEQAAVRIREDKELSPEGKARRLAENEAARQAAVAALKEKAAQEIALTRSIRATELANVRNRLVDERRYETAQPGGEKALVGGYGAVELRRRTADRTPDAAEYAAQRALHEGEPVRLRELEREIERLDAFDVNEVDRVAATRELAAIYGVQPESVRAADYAAESA